MKILLLLGLILVVAVGCSSSPTATPVPAPTLVPTEVPPTTVAPSPTPLPPTPTTAPTRTRVPATSTPLPTTPAPTATNTRRPVTVTAGVTTTVTVRATATLTPTATAVVLKYPAPALIEPFAGQVHRAGSEDLQFRWQPVAALGSNECYLLTVRVTNTVDSQYAEQSFIAQNTCGHPGDTRVEFVLKRRAPAPNYDGLVDIANSRTPGNNFVVTWYVTVVQNNGADPNKPDPSLYVPLSPKSETFEFNLQG